MKNFILYEGPSVLDGKPIVCIATLNSKNAKTGNMVQTWIIRSDINPIEAAKSLDDSSVCGGCPLRSGIGGACYVSLHHAPNSIFKSFQKGNYAKLSDNEIKEALRNKAVRLGAYGDPAAVPASVWENALELSRKHTGYTHQINHKKFDSRILDWCMVSAETSKQVQGYHAQNLRTFRIITPESPMFANEIVCPSETGISCVECGLCNGSGSDKPSIVIEVHGTRSRKHSEKYNNANLIAVSG